MSDRAAIIRSNRPRGVYVPVDEAQGYLHAGWALLDECLPIPGAPHRDEVLLLPPDQRAESAS